MTFGAAGDTTVVRTFPYGVPEGADSLVRLSFGADDTVRHVPGRLLPTDSLPEPFSPVLPADTVSAADIYGPVSFVPVAGAPEPCGIPVTFDVGYQMLTVLLLLFYLLLVFRAGGHAARMMRAVWGRGGEGKHRHDGDMPGAEVQALILACGLLMCGLAAVKIFELWGEWRWLPSSLWGGGWLAVPAVMLALLAVMGVQSAVLHVVGKLTFSTEFIRMLCAKRLSLFASMTVTGTPAVLLAALSGGVWADVAAGLFVAVTVAHLALYAGRSFLWFIDRKVSILLWILYLCAVEAMPFGIFAVGLSRCWPV
ncbi:MAG: DUF4271 domain-containing protein [Rikenellaceae bacterium]|nr:DUF4271 domain-containing protein [Rikenellaceae bacterium]